MIENKNITIPVTNRQPLLSIARPQDASKMHLMVKMC
jgi:hypothetical protein